MDISGAGKLGGSGSGGKAGSASGVKMEMTGENDYRGAAAAAGTTSIQISENCCSCYRLLIYYAMQTPSGDILCKHMSNSCFHNVLPPLLILCMLRVKHLLLQCGNTILNRLVSVWNSAVLLFSMVHSCWHYYYIQVQQSSAHNSIVTKSWQNRQCMWCLWQISGMQDKQIM